MSVSLTPSSQLGFNRPLTTLVKRILTVTNHNEQPVAFKVKTTAPKTYSVRPNSGRIEAGESVEVQVLLQAMREDPPPNVKCKDKFLVQSTVITPEKESLPLNELWNAVDGEDSTVYQQKIKVVYLPPIGQAVEEEEESAMHHQSSLMSTPGDHKYDAVRQSPSQNGSFQHSPQPPIPLPMFNGDHSLSVEPHVPIDRALSPAANYSLAQEVPHEEELAASGQGDIFSPPPPPATAAPPPQIPTPAPYQKRETMPSEAELELRARLSEAQAEIERLRNLLASTPDQDGTGLRHRNRALSDDETVVSNSETDFGTEVATQIHPEGVPVQTVAIISFLVFLITYLFF